MKIDLSKYLDLSKPEIIIGEKTYQVDNSFATTIKIDEIISEDKNKNVNISTIHKCLEICIGKKEAEEISKYSTSFVKRVFQSVFSALTGEEEAEESDVSGTKKSKK